MINCDRPVCSTVWQATIKHAHTIVAKCFCLMFKPPIISKIYALSYRLSLQKKERLDACTPDRLANFFIMRNRLRARLATVVRIWRGGVSTIVLIVKHRLNYHVQRLTIRIGTGNCRLLVVWNTVKYATNRPISTGTTSDTTCE